jgi:hypothetical protein
VLTALLVRLAYARVGSTLLMRMLASAPEVICDRAEPYEHRSLAALARLTEAADGQPGVALARAWRAFSAATRLHSAVPVQYYAEKSVTPPQVLVEAGIHVRTVDLVRDPRDIFASVRAFAAQHGAHGSGWRTDLPECANLALFLCQLAERLDELARPLPVAPIVVRYEDLARDPPSVAARLGPRLGLTIDPASAMSDTAAARRHITAPTAATSIGRWQRDLDQATAEAIRIAMGERMARFGYQLAHSTSR